MTCWVKYVSILSLNYTYIFYHGRERAAEEKMFVTPFFHFAFRISLHAIANSLFSKK